MSKANWPHFKICHVLAYEVEILEPSPSSLPPFPDPAGAVLVDSGLQYELTMLNVGTAAAGQSQSSSEGRISKHPSSSPSLCLEYRHIKYQAAAVDLSAVSKSLYVNSAGHALVAALPGLGFWVRKLFYGHKGSCKSPRRAFLSKQFNFFIIYFFIPVSVHKTACVMQLGLITYGVYQFTCPADAVTLFTQSQHH